MKKIESKKKSSKEKMTGYCVKCKEKREMKDYKIVTLKSGMNAAKGSCVKCGTNMCKIIGKGK